MCKICFYHCQEKDLPLVLDAFSCGTVVLAVGNVSSGVCEVLGNRIENMNNSIRSTIFSKDFRTNYLIRTRRKLLRHHTWLHRSKELLSMLQNSKIII